LSGGEVDLEVKVPRVFFGIDVFTRSEDTGIGNDDIESAVVSDDLIDCGFECYIIRDVAYGT